MQEAVPPGHAAAADIEVFGMQTGLPSLFEVTSSQLHSQGSQLIAISGLAAACVFSLRQLQKLQIL